MEKSIIILYIYDRLLNGRSVTASECMARFGISLSTFYRYVNTVRAFLWEKACKEICYDPKTTSYYIEGATSEP